MIPAPVARHGRLVALGLLLALGACGGTPAPTATPAPATADAAPTTPRPANTATAPTAAPAVAAGARATATRAATADGAPGAPAATAERATPPAAPPAAATATRGTTTPAGTVAPAAVPPAATPGATPRGYAPDDPCAPYAAGAVPPNGRAVAAAPMRLCIPALALSAPVIPVGVKVDGALDEPDDLATVGWYAPGVPPGAVGNAVLDGKFDGADGEPGLKRGVFWDLSLLRPGDLIVVVDEAGTARRFRVLATAVYRREAAPLLGIFGEAPDANLNLITAAGALVPGEPRYDSNLVIFARLAP